MSVAAHWEGPMSVALYARTRHEEQAIRALISENLASWLEQRREEMRIVMVPACSLNADAEESFPINELRYHAVACATTELVRNFVPFFLWSQLACSMQSRRSPVETIC